MKRGGLNYIVEPLIKPTSQPCSKKISQAATGHSAAKWQEDNMQGLLKNADGLWSAASWAAESITVS
jgi:hypothetical protein